jgi:thermitase
MIINLSLGTDGDTPLLHQVIKSGYDQGVIFFGAAGNLPVTTPTYPAAYTELVAVTAGDQQGRISSYANRGSFIDVIAPGSALINFQNQSFVITGTSAATAYASGMAAGLVDTSGRGYRAAETAIRQMLAPKRPAAVK